MESTMESHSADMLSKLRSQREAGLFCDITLRTNGRPYLAHRAVLAAVSDHFQEIFTEMDSSMKADIDLTGKNRWLEAKVTLENITALALRQFRGWIWT
uniref:BTB domain-containing protein n=1 Tax=Dicentrarchus labrax TaxID=13489 RepID=A0A8C4IRN4_DICLA